MKDTIGTTMTMKKSRKPRTFYRAFTLNPTLFTYTTPKINKTPLDPKNTLKTILIMLSTLLNKCLSNFRFSSTKIRIFTARHRTTSILNFILTSILIILIISSIKITNTLLKTLTSIRVRTKSFIISLQLDKPITNSLTPTQINNHLINNSNGIGL